MEKKKKKKMVVALSRYLVNCRCALLRTIQHDGLLVLDLRTRVTVA